ncbi:hypothetical protein [Shewanella fidelis]|uniref:hypothetical protein n=1 Tax=Shewanella fidelis TaxID=173509 RepID=UPI00048ECBBE|nr:hypothetical protein [Shewanella fidelis]
MKKYSFAKVQLIFFLLLLYCLAFDFVILDKGFSVSYVHRTEICALGVGVGFVVLYMFIALAFGSEFFKLIFRRTNEYELFNLGITRFVAFSIAFVLLLSGYIYSVTIPVMLLVYGELLYIIIIGGDDW